MLLNTSNTNATYRVSPLKFIQTRNNENFGREFAFKSSSGIETAQKHYEPQMVDIETAQVTVPSGLNTIQQTDTYEQNYLKHSFTEFK